MELKPPTTIEKQISLLKERGCAIDDEVACAAFLNNVNYYRLSAYFLPFRRKDHTYQDGVSFDKIKDIYNFDQALRSMIFTSIEEIEICTRTRIAYFHAHHYGAQGYWLPENYIPTHRHSDFVSRVYNALDNNKDIPWVMHHQQKYNGQYPIWAIVELFSLGMLSRFYADLQLEDRKKIASQFHTKEDYLRNWLHTLTSLRNTCAHYGRLYYMKFTNFPRFPKHIGLKPTGRLFDQLLNLKLLAPEPERWNASFLTGLSALMERYAASIHLPHIGFPNDWGSILHKASPRNS